MSLPTDLLCPVCRKRPVMAAFKPFCSKRCADIDLGRWLGEGYRVAGQDGAANEPETDPDEG